MLTKPPLIMICNFINHDPEEGVRLWVEADEMLMENRCMHALIR